MVMKTASFLLLLGLFYVGMMAPDYIICSGYVNTLHETQNLHFDLSKIKISLYYDGILKDTTSCNPDGSYVLSIDEREKRPFTLVPEGPTTATFDPPNKVIDPAKNISLCKTNIIFVFLGFTVTGQVKSKYSNTGPAGFPVQLSLEDKTMLKSTVTESGGHYKFDNVYPGDYVVSAAPSSEFIADSSASSYNCKVSWTSTEACSKHNIIVSGYYIKGRIEKPLSGLVVALYSKSQVAMQDLKHPETQKYVKDLPTLEGYHLLLAKQISTIVPFC